MGSFGVVRRATDTITNTHMACKVIPIGKKTREDIETEVRILRRVESHPGVVEMIDAYEKDGSVHIVTELLLGGDLLLSLRDRGSFSEDDARQIFIKVMESLSHVHAAGVVHRDVKLDNLVMVEPYDVSSVRLIDFGMAAELDGSVMNMRCGTPHFIAPEVILSSQSYGTEVDVWAAGVVLFQLLSGYLPFDARTVRELFKKIIKGKADFNDPAWSMVSPEAADLTRKLLTVDPSKRPTPEEAMTHPWVVER